MAEHSGFLFNAIELVVAIGAQLLSQAFAHNYCLFSKNKLNILFQINVLLNAIDHRCLRGY